LSFFLIKKICNSFYKISALERLIVLTFLQV